MDWDIKPPKRKPKRKNEAESAPQPQIPVALRPQPMPSLAIALPEVSLVKAQFDFAMGQIGKLREMVDSLEVDSEEGEKTLVTLGGEAKRLYKLVEARRVAIGEAPRKFISSVNNIASTFLDVLKAIEAIAKKKQKDFRLKMEIEAQKRAEEQKKAAQELQRKLDAEAAEATRKAQEEAKEQGLPEAEASVFSAPIVPTPTVVDAKPQVRTDSGITAFSVPTWKFEITDPALIPREYCEPSGSKIRDAVKEGVREIPGCRIYSESDIRWRT